MTAEIRAVRAKAAALVRQGWCQHHFAVNARGQPVMADSKMACGWCAIGALDRATDDDGLLFQLAMKAVERDLGVPALYDWNDAPGRTADEVARALEGR